MLVKANPCLVRALIHSARVASSILTSALRGFAGRNVRRSMPIAAPEHDSVELLLYEFENCPYCRRVREVMTVLDLDAEIRPCPKGGRRFRTELLARGGKAQFPYLVDLSQRVEMYESGKIIQHLYRNYGHGESPGWSGNPIDSLSGSLASGLRFGSGMRARQSTRPKKLLELWSFEASPFSRLVRERLSELELPYRLRNLGKRSPKRAAFHHRFGRLQVPLLVDPNADLELFESRSILNYLSVTYGAARART